eukprot:365304-Chlamydomonas_euryale.AAC.8
MLNTRGSNICSSTQVAALEEQPLVHVLVAAGSLTLVSWDCLPQHDALLRDRPYLHQVCGCGNLLEGGVGPKKMCVSSSLLQGHPMVALPWAVAAADLLGNTCHPRLRQVLVYNHALLSMWTADVWMVVADVDEFLMTPAHGGVSQCCRQGCCCHCFCFRCGCMYNCCRVCCCFAAAAAATAAAATAVAFDTHATGSAVSAAAIAAPVTAAAATFNPTSSAAAAAAAYQP